MTRISGVGTGAGKGLGGVVLAVGAGEHGDDHLAALPRRSWAQRGARLRLAVGSSPRLGPGLAVGVHRLQLALPDLLQLQPYPASRRSTRRHTPLVVSPSSSPAGANRRPSPARWSRTWARTSRWVGISAHHLEADAVAQAHLEQGLGHAAVAHGAGRMPPCPLRIICSTIL